MMKRISVLAVAGLMALPALALAGGSRADLERKIDELERQLQELKTQVSKQNQAISEQKQAIGEYSGKVEKMDTALEQKSEAWENFTSRFQFDGDFRARGDYYKADTLFGSDEKNDTLLTNRLRLNMRAAATENVEFKGRLAMYKVWGMQSTPDGLGGGFPIFDGNTTRTPSDSALYVDRAFVNWNNIGGAPVWFSIGRRPTTDGPPAQLRMNYSDERLATPVAYMDYPFDGLSLGYAYDWGNDVLGNGRIRFCYGRGFESGLQSDNNPLWNNDTDFAGFSWDVFQQGSRFLNIQVFGAFNLFNYPAFSSDLVRYGAPSVYGNQVNVGNIYHTSGVYMAKFSNLNYFIAGGWSRTDPNGHGMFNDYASATPINTDPENGYSVYAGIRYDMDNIGLKAGAEYNYGSQYWVSFSPGHDDIYMSKLATRGSVYELYLLYDLPTGEAISQYAKTFIRLGWQHYEYNYSGYFDWNMKPYDLDSERAQLQMLGQNPVTSANQVYLTFEVHF